MRTDAEIVKEVCIPACNKHEGYKSVKVKLRWVCPICGQPRGDIKNVRSYDGSLILFCNGWDNPCGHIDKYDALRKEAADMLNAWAQENLDRYNDEHGTKFAPQWKKTNDPKN